MLFKTIHCGSCHADYGLTEDAVESLRSTNNTFYCPHCGSSRWYPPPEESPEEKIKKLKKENKRVTMRNVSLENNIRIKQRQLSAQKSVSTRRKNELEKLKGSECSTPKTCQSQDTQSPES